MGCEGDNIPMALFYIGDSVSLTYANLPAGKRFWIDTFGCKESKVPEDWDNRLPSDVALKLPGDDEPMIGLWDKAEVHRAGYERPNVRQIVFCRGIDKAREHLASKGLSPTPIQELGGMRFFEIRDCEGNSIEICMEQ